MNLTLCNITYYYFTDVELVRPKYDAILQSLPIDYEKTLQAIQDHLTDEQMCSVLSNSNYTSANKVILNCLVENMSSRGNLLLLCEYLQKIVPLSHDPESLTSTLNVLRAGQDYSYSLQIYSHELFHRYSHCYINVLLNRK